VSHGRIGNVLRDKGDLALDSYKVSLAIAERLVKTDPGNVGLDGATLPLCWFDFCSLRAARQ
jgi:hypothetical protein